MAALTFNPSRHPALAEGEVVLIRQLTDFTREFFRNPKFDSSHDFNHVMRVVSNAIQILEKEARDPDTPSTTYLDAFVVIAGALLHDVDDRKYVDASIDVMPVAEQEMLRLGISQDKARRIQLLIEGVSYSSEMKNPAKTQDILRQIPELAIVQDADRLDAIGAVGIARCFTFGGAKQARTLEHSVDHFHDKLVKLGGMMKTKTGRKSAEVRTERLRNFLTWWEAETDFGLQTEIPIASIEAKHDI